MFLCLAYSSDGWKPLECLKLVEMSGFRRSRTDVDVELATYLVRNALYMEKILLLFAILRISREPCWKLKLLQEKKVTTPMSTKPSPGGGEIRIQYQGSKIYYRPSYLY